MGPPQRWGSLDELQPIGQEDADQRSVGLVEQTFDECPVDPQALGLTGGEAHRQLVLAIIVRGRTHDDARCGRAEPHNLALIGRAAGTASASEVQPLEEVGLAGAI